MARAARFHYAGLSDLTAEAGSLGLDLPASEDVSVLFSPARLGRRALANRLVVHPMEGCDAGADGRPGELTFRRYQRWAGGGAGLVWFEATAVVPEGRANPHQLWLHPGSASAFAELVRRGRAAAAEAGASPLFVLQLTHSGRYSRPEGPPRPVIGHHHPALDAALDLPADYPLVSDEDLDGLVAAYAAAARLAAEAGFDGVDIKACHRYLVNELLAGHIRPGRYGGQYANRTRLLREVTAAVAAAVGGRLEIACRLNVYDGLEYPYGWGVSETAPDKEHDQADPQSLAFGGVQPELREPLRLVGELIGLGLTCLSVTAGNPRFFPHLNRPTGSSDASAPPPPERPLRGIWRLVHLTGRMQQAYPDLPVVGAGWSWLRRFVPNFAASAIAAGRATLMGLGRGALAYPDFASDLRRHGAMDPGKVCIACGRCSQMLRGGRPVGCAVRDAKVYGREGRS